MSEDKAKYNKEGIVIKYFDEEICMHPFSEVESIDEKGCRVCYKNGSYAYYIGKPVRIGKTADYIGLINYSNSLKINVIIMSEDELCNFTTVCDGAVAGEDVDCPSDTGPARVTIDYEDAEVEMIRFDVCNARVISFGMGNNLGDVSIYNKNFIGEVVGNGTYYFGLFVRPTAFKQSLLCLSKEDTLAYAAIRSERIDKEKEAEAKEIQATIDKMANKIELNDGFALLVRQENNHYQILEIKKGHYENVGKSCIARESSLVFIDSAPGVGSFYAVDYGDIIGFIKE